MVTILNGLERRSRVRCADEATGAHRADPRSIGRSDCPFARKGGQSRSPGVVRGALGRCLIGAVCASSLVGCQGAGDEVAAARTAQPLLLDPAFEGDGAEPAKDYTLFEADPVRPVATLAKSSMVAVTNTVSDTLD